MPQSADNRIIVILATANRDKVKELRPLLEHISPLFTVHALHELGVEVEIEETEDSLEGNALLKARAIFSLLSDRFPFMIALRLFMVRRAFTLRALHPCPTDGLQPIRIMFLTCYTA